MAKTIESICKARSIISLFHFTKIQNIPSIIKEGLLTRAKLDKSKMEYYCSDMHRIDGQKNSVSLSISYPNSSMFYGKRAGDFIQRWAVIELDSSILFEKDCKFYPDNAAASVCTALMKECTTGVNAFNALFTENGRDNFLTDEYPTNLQAEVLCLEDIESNLIYNIYVCNNDDIEQIVDYYSEKYLANFEEHDYDLFEVNSKYFNSREYFLNGLNYGK